MRYSWTKPTCSTGSLSHCSNSLAYADAHAGPLANCESCRGRRVGEACLVGEADGLDAAAAGGLLEAVGEVERLEDVSDVRLDGGVTDEQLLGDLGVGEAACDQLEDFEFALGEVVQLLGPLTPRRAGELVDHVLCDGGRQEGVSSGDDADR